MEEPLLSIQNLCVAFRVYEGLAEVLTGVSLDVIGGQRVGLVGETGCGKSVTVKAVMGMLTGRNVMVSGSALFDKVDLLKLNSRELRRVRGSRISMIPQDPMSSLNPVFTIGKQVRDVFRYGQSSKKRASAREIDRTAHDILREVRLPDPKRMMTSYSYQLSGGMRQRVLIGLALVNRPQLVIEDEPGTALDVTVQSQILELIDNLVKSRGLSTILITHNLGVIRESTDFANIMYGGNVVERARTEDLFSSPKHFYTQALLECVPKLTREGIPKGIDGMIPDYTRAPSGCRYHPRCTRTVGICKEQVPNMRHVGNKHEVACHLYPRRTA